MSLLWARHLWMLETRMSAGEGAFTHQHILLKGRISSIWGFRAVAAQEEVAHCPAFAPLC
jgi:hypothetical protein